MAGDGKEVVVNPGDWVILKSDVVIWANKDLGKVLRKAESMEDDDITVTKEPYPDSLFY